MWRLSVLPMVIAAAILGGCGSGEPSEPRAEGEPGDAAAEWEAPARYEFVLDSSCGLRKLKGRFRVVVDKGEIAEVEPRDEQAERFMSPRVRREIPTLDELIEKVAVARREDADVAELETDPSGGRPTRVKVDPSTDVVDDEECYAVSAYAALE